MIDLCERRNLREDSGGGRWSVGFPGGLREEGEGWMDVDDFCEYSFDICSSKITWQSLSPKAGVYDRGTSQTSCSTKAGYPNRLKSQFFSGFSGFFFMFFVILEDKKTNKFHIPNSIGLNLETTFL